MVRHTVLLRLLVVGLTVGAALPALSAEKADRRDNDILKQATKEVREDFLVPPSPAFIALGVSPQEVIRPDTPKAFAMALLNGIDGSGNLQNGVAIDVAPYYLFRGRHLSLNDYRNSKGAQVASRFQLSLATAKGAGDESMRAGIGLRFSVLDRGDPRMSPFLDDCYNRIRGHKLDKLDQARIQSAKISSSLAINEARRQEAEKGIAADATPKLEADLRRLLQEKVELQVQHQSAAAKEETLKAEAEGFLKTAWDACNRQFEKRSWNATNLTIGVVPTFYSGKGDIGNMKEDGWATYATFAYGFDGVTGLEDNSQVILHTRYRSNERVATAGVPSGFVDQDVLVAGVQIRVAGPTVGIRSGGRDIGFYIEFDYQRTDRDVGADSDSYKYVLGAEYKIADDLSLSLTIGDVSGDDGDASGTFTLGGLSWSF